MQAQPPVVCAGVIVADHLCTPIDHMPVAGELIQADDLILNIGGCAANVAIALSRLGIRPTLCGRVGNDVFGRFVTETLEAESIDVRGLGIDPQFPTSQTLIVNVRGQDRRFIHTFGANAGLSVSDLDAILENPPRVLYLGGFLILPGLEPSALADSFARARSRGVFTVLDVVCPGPGDHRERLQRVLPHTDLFLPNEDEGRLILGEDDPMRQALAFHEMGAQRVVITRGGRGSISVSASNRVQVGSFSVPFLDATGGGDAFDAGYIARYLEGGDELSCLTFASAIGASCVRAVGTTAGLFTKAEAEAFIAANALEMQEIS